eukprot:6393404-Prymnesium_polylepis.1
MPAAFAAGMLPRPDEPRLPRRLDRLAHRVVDCAVCHSSHIRRQLLRRWIRVRFEWRVRIEHVLN